MLLLVFVLYQLTSFHTVCPVWWAGQGGPTAGVTYAAYPVNSRQLCTSSIAASFYPPVYLFMITRCP